ncbi:hypothetical protein JVT61DRAFT_15639 [Boletus reticuloceps]|uniref:Uncharacterized protein n=1 Tax=Boletus reticuloceps TaxID=495285 RepID=A0A8I2YC65_9AGAM|nr:hypothetical protein JVT61DRAFT_15639 [Boletus reticuloceps]
MPALESQLPKDSELKEDNVEGPLVMLHERVTGSSISQVVTKAKGIPTCNSSGTNVKSWFM